MEDLESVSSNVVSEDLSGAKAILDAKIIDEDEDKNKLKTVLKGLPISFHWICLEFEDKTFTFSINTRTQKDRLRNFDCEELSIEIFREPKWYKTKIIAHAGKKSFKLDHFLLLKQDAQIEYLNKLNRQINQTILPNRHSE